MLRERLIHLLAWLRRRCRPDKVMYIGGSDTLPPPLPRDEEAEMLAAGRGGICRAADTH